MAPSQLGAFAPLPRRTTPRPTCNSIFAAAVARQVRRRAPSLPGPSPRASCNLRPSSRGSIHAASPDPRLPGRSSRNYLATDEDGRGRRPTRSGLVPQIVTVSRPGALSGRRSTRPGPDYAARELAQAAGEIGTTTSTPSATAKWARHRPDGGADARSAGARRRRAARGGRLRHAPITSGNTNSPTIISRRRRRR